MFDFGLVKEALEERGLLLTRLAPHLVRPVPFLYPLHKAWERPYVGAGLALYDAMAMLGKYDMGVPQAQAPLPQAGRPDRARPHAPSELHGAIRYYDCQVDDARLVMTIARTAASHGAHVATRTKVTGFLREGERVVGRTRTRPRDRPRARGPRPGRRQRRRGLDRRDPGDGRRPRRPSTSQASKGIHLVVPRDRIRSEAGFITRTEKSVLFVIPWGRHWIIGTTDTAWNLDKAHPAASRADIDYLLGHVNAILREPLDHDDVEGVYAGLRPLLAGESRADRVAKISREHTVVTPVPGLVMIAGGKLTTYRVMARDAVDAAAHSLRTAGDAAVRDSITDRVPLVGAAGFEARTNQRVPLLARAGLHVGTDRPPARPVRRAGRRGARRWSRERPELAEPLDGRRGLPRRRGRLRRHPRGRPAPRRRAHPAYPHLDRDLRPRRRRARPAAELMAGELGWDAARVDDEVDHYLRRVEAERQSQLKLTDQEADEARVRRPTSSEPALA